MRRWLSLGLVLTFAIGFCLAVLPTAADAQAKITRPVQLICPWAAGGGTDRIARMVGILMEK